MNRSSGSILVEQHGRVGVLTISRTHKRNAMDDCLIANFTAEMQNLANSPLRSLVITGEGNRSFCSGYDIDCIDPDSQAHLPLPDVRFEPVTEAVLNCPFPVIAAMNGDAFGGGLDLALSCDFRIASSEASMAMTPCKIGLAYSAKGIARFINRLGSSTTRRLFLTAEILDAEQALNLGLVDRTVPKEMLLEEASNCANRIAGNGPLAVRATRRAIQTIEASIFNGINVDVLNELEYMRQTAFESADLKEGLKAFFDKRKPDFRGE